MDFFISQRALTQMDRRRINFSEVLQTEEGSEHTNEDSIENSLPDSNPDIGTLARQEKDGSSNSLRDSESSSEPPASVTNQSDSVTRESILKVSMDSIAKESSASSYVGMRQIQAIIWLTNQIEWLAKKYYEIVPYKYECILYVALLSIIYILIALDIMSFDQLIVSSQTEATILKTILVLFGLLALKFSNIVNNRYSSLVCIDKILHEDSDCNLVLKGTLHKMTSPTLKYLCKY